MKKPTLRYVIIAALLSWAVNIQATDGDWNVNASGNWSTPLVWTSIFAPGTAAGDTVGLTYNITAPRTITMDTTSRTVGALNIGDSGSSYFAYTLTNSGGATLTFDNSGSTANLVQVATTAADVIAVPITLSDNLSVSNNSTLTLSGLISGNRKITKTGSGVLTLTRGNANFTNMTVDGGTLALVTGFDVRALNNGSAPVAINSNATIQLGNGSGGGVNPFYSGTPLAISGGTLNVLDRTDIGQITMTGGSITGTSGTGASGRLYMWNGITTVASSTTATVGNGNLTMGNNNTFNVAQGTTGNGIDLDITAVLQGISNQGITKSGTGTMRLSATNLYTGSTVISAGTLQIGSGGTSGTLGAGSVVNNAALVFNRSDNLTVTNVISGTGALTMSGAGMLTLSGLNTYSGATVISAGTLQIGDGGTSGTLGTGNVANNAMLVFNRSDSSTVANVISGTGTLTKIGSGTMTVSGANTYGGSTVVDNGILKMGNSSALGNPNAGTFVTNNGTLDVNAISFHNPGELITISGNGLSSTGAVINTGADQIAALRYLTLAGNASIGAWSSRWDMRGTGPFNGAVDLNGFTLTKLGSGKVALVDLMMTNAGSIVVNAGTFTFVRVQTDNSGSITLNNSATLQLENNTSGSLMKPIVVNGSNNTLQNFGGVFTLGSSVTNLTGLRIDAATALTMTNVISGPGALVKVSSAPLTLQGTNTYTGTTTVSNGTLVVNGFLSTNTVTVATDATLMGTGTITGPVTIQSGATLQPGTNTVSLTISNTLNLAGTTLFALNRTNAQNSSRVRGITTATYGGTLTVTNIGPALVDGDTFTLFSGTTYSGTFSTINLPSLSAGLGWDTSQLAANGTITVGVIPSITTQPVSQHINLGTGVAFTVTAGGPNPLSYQWRLSGGTLSGATTSSITIASAQDSDLGNYSVVVANAYGSVTSSDAALTINHPPTLDSISNVTINEDASAQNISLSGISSGVGDGVQTLTVTAASSDTALIPNPAVTYTSPNATGSLQFTPVANANGIAIISVVVSDGEVSVTNSFTVTVNAVNDPPTINSLSDIQLVVGQSGNVTVSGIATGAGNESQTLSVTASSGDLSLATVSVNYTSPNSTAQLTVTAGSSSYDKTTVTVTVSDGIASVSRNFIVTVGVYKANFNTAVHAGYNGPIAGWLGNLRGKETWRDLVVANHLNGTLTVRLCNDIGSFLAPRTLTMGGQPSSVHTADVNRDKYEDIVASDFSTNSVVVLTNLKKGNFSAPVRHQIGNTSNPGTVAVRMADVNKDGRPDIITANQSENTVSVLLCTNATFGGLRNYPVGGSPNCIGITDLTQDTNVDLYVSFGGSIQILPGDGKGNFNTNEIRTITLFDSGDPQIMHVLAADLNGDARKDFVTANANSNTVSVLMAQADGSFILQDYAVGERPQHLLLRDINHDAKTDITVANTDSDTLSILIGNGDGTFARQLDIAAGDSPVAVLGSNFNADNATDLMVLNYNANAVRILLFNGPLAFVVNAIAREDTATNITLVGKIIGPSLQYRIVRAPAHGTLSVSGTFTDPRVIYTPATNYFGADSFSCTACTSTMESAPAEVKIKVVSVNDAPKFTPGSDILLSNPTRGYTNVWATAISAGPTTESMQKVAFTITGIPTGFYSVRPTITTNGVLRFRVAPKVFGTNLITVQLKDNGGIASGGKNASAVYTFSVRVPNP